MPAMRSLFFVCVVLAATSGSAIRPAAAQAAFDRLSATDQQTARAIYDAIANDRSGALPLTLDQIAAAKGDASWDDVKQRLTGQRPPAAPAIAVVADSAPESAAGPTPVLARDEGLPDGWRADGPPISLRPQGAFGRTVARAQARASATR